MPTTKVKKIDLLEIASRIGMTAKKLQEKVTETGESVSIVGTKLAGKYPELKNIDRPVFKIRTGRIEGTFACDTFTVFKSQNGNVMVYDCDLKPVENAVLTAYRLGIGGYAFADIDGVEFKIGLSTSPEYQEILYQVGTRPDETNGSPDPDTVRLLPCPLTPLHADKIKLETVYKIIGDDGVSNEFETRLLSIESETGETINRVAANVEITHIYETHGIGAKFKILNRYERRNKDGEIYDSETGLSLKDWEKSHAKGETTGEFKPQWKHIVLDLQGDDFSDFDV